MTTSLGPGPGPSGRPTLPKGDEYEHSQNSANRSIRQPCHNRGPGTDQRKTVRICPRVGGQRRLLADCQRVFEDVGKGASWNRPRLNRLKSALQPCYCVNVAPLDRLAQSLTEVLDLLGWIRENGVEIISLRESIDQDSAIGRAMLYLGIAFAAMELNLARERTLVGWSGSRPPASTADGAVGQPEAG